MFLYDKEGNQVGCYTGGQAAGLTIEVPGDEFSIRLVTDESVEEYGFSIDSIIALIGVMECQGTHEWESVLSYVWADDHYTVTASRECLLCSEIDSEVAHALIEIIEDPTCEETGIVKYTANFDNSAFETQVYVDTCFPALGHLQGETIIENIIEPTASSEGRHDEVVYCARCGKELSRTIVVDQLTPAFKSQSLVLSGQIGLNFFLELPEILSVDYSKSYMTFKIGKDPTEYRDNFDSNHMNSGKTRYGFTCFVNSIQMADTITATFHYGDGKTVSKEYSVLKYIEFFEDNISAFNAKTIALIRAVADFGHYEQIYLADVNGWTLGEKYAEMTTFYTTEFDYDAILSKVDGKAFVKELDGSGVTKATYKLHLDSETTVDVFLTPKSGVTLTASATFNGKTYAAEKQKDGRYLVQIPNISAHQLGDMITVTGNAGGAFTVKVSALSYVRSVLKSDTTNKAAKDGMSALYEYYAAVLAYRK